MRVSSAIVLMMLFSCAVCAAGFGSTGVHVVRQDQGGPGVTFRMPDKLMPMDFPKYKGMLLLDRDRPAGIFIVYVPSGETPPDTVTKIRETVASMFSSVTKNVSSWSVNPVPAEESRPSESAQLAMATGEGADMQMLSVVLPNGSTTVVYGYFALRHTTKPQKDDAVFLKEDGTGVAVFDKFRKTIKPGKSSAGKAPN